MSYDGLVDFAEKNGGKARMGFGPNAVLPQNNVPLPSGQNFLRASPAPSNTEFPQTESHRFHFQGHTSVDPLEGLEQANRCYNAAKEYKKTRKKMSAKIASANIN